MEPAEERGRVRDSFGRVDARCEVCYRERLADEDRCDGPPCERLPRWNPSEELMDCPPQQLLSDRTCRVVTHLY